MGGGAREAERREGGMVVEAKKRKPRCAYRVLSPDDLSAGRDEAQFADVDLDHGSLGDDAERGVERALRVLLDTDDWQLESCPELGVGDVGLLVAQGHWPDKPFVFGRLPREAVADEGSLGHHAFPRFCWG
ncbi:MAG: hypothetical protein BJ554DRAFT_522 [Olpidium bornovanus]|uniref:Uncharacterized protein n=1 Tax=Olpidium bornovanus TaxID=278681 RepID=A0A8H7ZTA7_9FUNG|nr:MAG: hypothetical protein BJ554DRAFT_522 [Olpidium bornovanus]